MSERGPQHTIYLDLDGVIFPYWHKSDGDLVRTESGGPLQSRSELQGNLKARWIDRHEFYYPAITKQLGAIAAQGAQIIGSSSRSLDLFIHYPSVRDDLGDVERFLSIDTFEPGRIDHKAEAVIKNWQGVIDLSNERRGWERRPSLQIDHPTSKPPGSRAVWIDDHATPKILASSPSAYAKEALSIPSLKIINPLGTVGLTMAQLDEVEDFLFNE
ncbi:MAG TPA: hypothetical protein PKD28_01675 [Candidatus Saccharibacteria bacterium]|nr:hypothetical protein [Candidatus Saccharibacteria bacterium]